LQAKYHKADGSNRSSQSENGDVKPSSHKQYSRQLSSQQSVSQDESTGSVKDQDSESENLKPTSHETKHRRVTNHGSNRDLNLGGVVDNKLTVGKSRARHKSCDVQRSKMMSGPSSDLEGGEDVETRAGAAENSGLLSVSVASAGAAMSRSNQDLSGNYLKFSPRPSSSRLSSRVDLRGFDSTHRRTASAVSASTSVGSGLDDDDYIDPHRDVGVAVYIRDGYFSWLPRADGEALMSDVNFVADAGQSSYVTFMFYGLRAFKGHVHCPGKLLQMLLSILFKQH